MVGGLCVDEEEMAEGTPDVDDGWRIVWCSAESERNRGANACDERNQD
jgi:hypothetical protein